MSMVDLTFLTVQGRLLEGEKETVDSLESLDVDRDHFICQRPEGVRSHLARSSTDSGIRVIIGL